MKKNIEVRGIVCDWLTEHGYDGLANPDAECGCLLSDLAPCKEMMESCRPGRKIRMINFNCGSSDPEKHDWHVVTDPPDAINDAREWVCDCGERCDPQSEMWRWNGLDWEHCHGYPLGHVIATRKPQENKPVEANFGLRSGDEGFDERLNQALCCGGRHVTLEYAMDLKKRHSFNMSEKCIVHGCVNRRKDGAFVGNFCSSCWSMLTTGKVGKGSSFIHELHERLVATDQKLSRANEEISEQLDSLVRKIQRWMDE